MKKIVLGILMVLVLGCTKDEVMVAPLAPTELIVTNILATQVNLSWTDNSTSETGFKIQRKGATGSYVTVGTVGADITVYEDKGLTINTAYSYRVLSYNDGGDSITYSNEVTASTDGVSVINTSDVINVRATSATVGGSVFGDGGSAITERGVVWSTSPNPTVALTTKVIDVNVFNNYSFSSTITGLNLSTKYYVRAYATNEAGTAYGTELSFTTLDGVATLTTNTPSNIRAYSATLGGDILGDGGSNITDKGIVWSTSSNPTIALSTKTNEGSGGARFSNIISGLNLNTKYYVRAYAKNEIGTYYGAELTFTTMDGVAILSTTTPSEIRAFSAAVGGTVSSDGGSNIISKGIVWNTSATPTIALGTKINFGSGEGTFETFIEGLRKDTKYFVRAYATNEAGTFYGTELSFTTMDGVAILSTITPNTIYAYSTLSGGLVTSDGGDYITARGVVWSTSSNPTINLSTKTINGSDIGEFNGKLSELLPETIYYVRSYATNSIGTTYGNEKSFKTNLIGKNFQGGRIFYIFKSGDIGYVSGETHGLITSLSDQSKSVIWYVDNNNHGFITSNEIGMGKKNCDDIMNLDGFGAKAIKLCADFSIDNYDDWYLPSINELFQLNVNRDAIGVFSGTYWSSSQTSDAGYTSVIGFGQSNPQYNSRNTYENSVRAVRTF